MRSGVAVPSAAMTTWRMDPTKTWRKVEERLERERVAPRCGLMVVDLRTGDIAHWLRIRGVVRELYDVTALPGRRNPSMIG